MQPKDFKLDDLADYGAVLNNHRKNRGQLSYHDQTLNPLLERHPELEKYVAEEAINTLHIFQRNSGIQLNEEQKITLLNCLAGMFYEGFFTGRDVQQKIIINP